MKLKRRHFIAILLGILSSMIPHAHGYRIEDAEYHIISIIIIVFGYIIYFKLLKD